MSEQKLRPHTRLVNTYDKSEIIAIQDHFGAAYYGLQYSASVGEIVHCGIREGQFSIHTEEKFPYRARVLREVQPAELSKFVRVGQMLREGWWYEVCPD